MELSILTDAQVLLSIYDPDCKTVSTFKSCDDFRNDYLPHVEKEEQFINDNVRQLANTLMLQVLINFLGSISIWWWTRIQESRLPFIFSERQRSSRLPMQVLFASWTQTKLAWVLKTQSRAITGRTSFVKKLLKMMNQPQILLSTNPRTSLPWQCQTRGLRSKHKSSQMMRLLKKPLLSSSTSFDSCKCALL